MSDIENKPKRVMTEEQKAKLKAGREAAKAKREAEKAAGIEPAPKVKKEKKSTTDGEGSDTASTTSSKTKRVMTEEQKAKMKAGREAAKAKREAEKAAGIVTPKKERKSKSPSAPKKTVLTKEIWQAVLDEVKKDMNTEFAGYVQSKLE